MLSAVGLLSLLSAAPLLGCSSNSDQGGSASDFAAKYCALLMPCCTKYELPTDGANCRALFGSVSVGYDAAMGEACLREMKAAESNPDFCAGGNTLAPSCAKIYPQSTPVAGTKKPGEACKSNTDCATSPQGNVSCVSATFGSSSSSEICQLAIAGKEGDGPCTGTVHEKSTFSTSSGTGDRPAQTIVCDVKDGVYCPSTTSGAPPPSCTRIAEIGAPCLSSFGGYSCVTGAYCDSTSKTCKAKLAIGATCTTYGSYCVEGSYCEASTTKCTAQLAEGATCKTSEQCATHSCEKDKCVKPNLTGFAYLLICGPPKL
jgi:hypothetical protein